MRNRASRIATKPVIIVGMNMNSPLHHSSIVSRKIIPAIKPVARFHVEAGDMAVQNPTSPLWQNITANAATSRIRPKTDGRCSPK